IDANVKNRVDGGKRRDEAIEKIDSVSTLFNELTNDFAVESAHSINRSWTVLSVGMSTALVVSVILSIALIKTIVGPLNHISLALSEGSHAVERTSGQVSSASNQVADGNSRNASSLEETSASVEELSSMTKRNAENAKEAQGLIKVATDSVESSKHSMDKVMEAMGQIATSGNEIGKIIKTIDEIAFQTNLLALNAAVEAARAGEAGAGFAVVADEVRNLAIRSADAAKNTAELIAQTIDNINSGSSMVNMTSESFGEVVENVRKVSAIIGEVAVASNEQSIGINQINTAISEMDQVTQSNAAISEETAGAASTLSTEAYKLDEQVQELMGLITGSKHRELPPQPEYSPSGHNRGRLTMG
ncbi:MAG: methyl-accepting chemotaxis protein, partial [Deltaproteobacteria bacterium]|nr:methyl-accepting chemotaxis protein [Deltaproteobacteria bacterium]